MIGFVYKITYLDVLYIGSTVQKLKYRFRQHKQSKCSISKYFDIHGADNFIIELIKQYNVFDRKHLNMYEQLWINKLKCVNEQSAMNFECINKKEKIKEYMKKYYKKNKIKINEKANEKIDCKICKTMITKKNLNRHLKSAKHINNL